MNCEHPPSALIAMDSCFAWCSRCGSLQNEEVGVWRPPSMVEAMIRQVESVRDDARATSQMLLDAKRGMSERIDELEKDQENKAVEIAALQREAARVGGLLVKRDKTLVQIRRMCDTYSERAKAALDKYGQAGAHMDLARAEVADRIFGLMGETITTSVMDVLRSPVVEAAMTGGVVAPPEPKVDYVAMDGGAMIDYCGADAARWAAAFVQHATRIGYHKHGQSIAPIDEGWMIGWFANAMMRALDIRRWNDEKKLSASEAVFGVLGWLTSHEHPVTFSRRHNAAPAAEIAGDFCAANELDPPRADWAARLKHPTCGPARSTTTVKFDVAPGADPERFVKAWTNADKAELRPPIQLDLRAILSHFQSMIPHSPGVIFEPNGREKALVKALVDAINSAFSVPKGPNTIEEKP